MAWAESLLPLCLCCVSADAASKHAAQAFFDCLRAEVEEFGIVVSTISHTFINASDPDPSADAQPGPKPNFLAECECSSSLFEHRVKEEDITQSQVTKNVQCTTRLITYSYSKGVGGNTKSFLVCSYFYDFKVV